ncbi:hypothetical protein HCA15_03655 [Listeria booriae]|uniref:hypothetical protein n=1 Tax=Listeria booriae TaxID=1552123 RepID=UPI00164D1D6C|nr:hypothetical protein [Listeria booriae]MBC6165732.1 hypothetical protein [Listeria booriae]
MDYLNKVLQVSDETNFWFIRAQGGKYYEDFVQNDFIAISDNKLSLNFIQSFKKRNKISIENSQPEILVNNVELYKVIVKEAYPDYSKQKCTLTANKLLNFTHNMSLGDIVIVPGKQSDFFAIGIICSDVFEVTDEYIAKSRINNKYKICDFYKRRKVLWVREVDRKKISEKLYWLLSAHQSLFNLTSSAHLIIPLIAQTYTFEGKINSAIYINTTSNINNDTWYSLHSAIKSITKENSKNIDIKINVQSPGITFLQAAIDHWPDIVAVTTVLYGVTIGNVNFGPVSFQGIVPYFFGDGKLDRERKRLENEGLKLENEAKKIVNDNLKKDGVTKDLDNLLKQRQLTESQNMELPPSSAYIDTKISTDDKAALSSLEITPLTSVDVDQLNKQDNFSLSSDNPPQKTLRKKQKYLTGDEKA